MNRFVLTCCIASTLLSVTTASAQDFDLSWNTVDSGGGHSTGGPYTLGGTIGQPDASNPMSGASLSLSGGFWYPAEAAPSTCPADLFPPNETCGSGDGVVGAGDLGSLLSSWGSCSDCCADLAPLPTGDNVVGPADLAALLASWGQCG